jgi:hypothetical protein
MLQHHCYLLPLLSRQKVQQEPLLSLIILKTSYTFVASALFPPKNIFALSL